MCIIYIYIYPSNPNLEIFQFPNQKKKTFQRLRSNIKSLKVATTQGASAFLTQCGPTHIPTSGKTTGFFWGGNQVQTYASIPRFKP